MTTPLGVAEKLTASTRAKQNSLSDELQERRKRMRDLYQSSLMDKMRDVVEEDRREQKQGNMHGGGDQSEERRRRQREQHKQALEEARAHADALRRERDKHAKEKEDLLVAIQEAERHRKAAEAALEAERIKRDRGLKGTTGKVKSVNDVASVRVPVLFAINIGLVNVEFTHSLTCTHCHTHTIIVHAISSKRRRIVCGR